MFGMGSEHHRSLEAIGHAIVQFLEVSATEEARAHADDETLRFTELVTGLAAQRRADPGDDLLTALVMAEDAGDHLTADELVSACFILTAAGHETTTNLIGNLAYTLLADRDRWDAVCADPTLVPSAVEETLRFESPFRAIVTQWPVEDTEVAGTTIRAGERVSLWMGAANRDPEAFTDPDRFDLERTPNRHLRVLRRAPLLPRRVTGAARSQGRAGRAGRALPESRARDRHAGVASRRAAARPPSAPRDLQVTPSSSCVQATRGRPRRRAFARRMRSQSRW